MQSRLAALAALLLASTATALADGDITGKAINKTTGEPIDFATVQLINAKTGKALPIGTNTDADGCFTLKNVRDGDYPVKITSVGSVDQERDVKVAGSNVNIGNVKMADDTKVLQEVVVEGVKSQMRFELDKKVFQVDANVAAAGQSASELLESIPSIEVDQDGQVSLRGSESVTVWINGKASGLSADNRAQILEQIPAETIESIEVITNPSAKYSPEGTSGIINIILKKDRRGGYFGSAELSANSRGGGNVGVNFNYNTSKWETYASVGFRMRHGIRGDSFDRTYTDGSFLNKYSENKNHGNNIFFRLGATYHLTDKDQFYVNGFGMFGHRWSHGTTSYKSNLPDQWTSNTLYNTSKSDSRGAHAELGYRHEWSKNHSLDILAGYNHWGGPNFNTYHENYSFADMPGYDPELFPDQDLYQEQTQHIGTNSAEVKVDYTQMLIDWLKLEAGFQGNYSHEDTPVSMLEGEKEGELAPNKPLYNTFIYNNNISALYFTLGGKVKNFSFSAGLRGEAWQIATKSFGYGETKYDVDWYRRDKFALFPSAYLSYSLPMDNEVQVNYTRRIRRPWGGQLNSFMDVRDPSNIQYGNPALEPEYANAFELNYIKSWTMHMISVSAYLRTANNTMNRISYLDGDAMYTTWANVASTLNAGVEIVAKNSLFRNHLDLTTTVNLYNNHISGWNLDFKSPITSNDFKLSGEKRNSFAWDARMLASVRLPWGLSLQVTGRYASKMLTAQGSRQGGWSVDAGLRKNLGDWSFSLNCRDIFDSRKFKSESTGIGYTQSDDHWHAGRTFRLTIKYSFGNMRAKRNKNNQAEPTDGSGYGGDEMSM